uniref:BRCT domain-containing protein n=1 Tax=Steinernema glaseri TaxID=37863 RepID=A0A1I7YSG6_9BILA
MTRVTLKHVISSSPSERGYEAQNLLHGTSDKRSKWLGKAGTKCNSVILKLDREYKFTNFHVGNANSALVEIFVSRSVDTQETFQVIVPSTSFMSQMESRSERPGDRVKIFGKSEMIPSVEAQNWDIVKVVCHQPFNDRIPFGLGFFKVDGDAEQVSTISPSKKVPAISMNFIDLDSVTQSSQTLSTGSLFEHREEMKKSREDYQKRVEEERRVAMLSKDGGKNLKKEAKKAVMSQKDVSKPERKREKVVAKTVDEDVDMEVLEVDEDRQPSTSKRKKETPSPMSSQGPTHPKRRVTIDSDEEDEVEEWPAASSKTSKSSEESEKIDGLLNGVCFSLSGYQNPMRSDLRDKGIEMGAKYCNDWTPECTHLVSAFKNTPKMRSMGKSAIAVSGRWIRRCYAEKKRLPESKYPVAM